MSFPLPSGSPLSELANAVSFPVRKRTRVVVADKPRSAVATILTDYLYGGFFEMLRMGRNPQEEKIETGSPEPVYQPRTQSPYQSGETNTRQSNDYNPATKALTESETLAREIKDGTLSGFVGSGTSVTGEATFKAM